MIKIEQQHMQIARRLKEAREQRGFSQTEVAARLGVKQQTIAKIEAGTTVKSKYLYPLAILLGVDLRIVSLDDKKISYMAAASPEPVVPVGPLFGTEDLPVYGSTATGAGAFIVSTEPVDFVARPAPLAKVRDGYGLIVVDDSMVPEFRPGQIALVHPHIPPRADDVCVFYGDGHGSVTSIIKTYRHQTATEWHVSQHNPPPDQPRDLVLPKAKWQKCHVVVGRYNHR